RGEWVIFLDADERLEKASVPTLRRLLRDPSVSAYEVCVVSRAVDERKNLASVYGYNPRLFRRADHIRFQYRIHESILPSVLRANGRVARADVTIDHIGYAGSDRDMQEKFRRNLTPLRLDAADFPDDLFVLEKLSQTEMILRHDAEAESYLHRILQLLDQGAAGDAYAIKAAHTCNLLSELCLWNNRLTDAEVHAKSSLRIAPRQYQAHALLSRIYEKQDRIDDALAETSQLLALSMAQPVFESDVEGDCNVLTEDILYKQSLLFRKQGREVHLITQTLEAALHANANHRPAQADLSVIYANIGDIDGILRILAAVPRTEQQSAALLYLRAQAQAKSGSASRAIDDLWAAFAHGLRSDDLIFLLVRLLNEQQREAESVPLYEEYLGRHPQADDARMLLLQLLQRLNRADEAKRFAAASIGSIVSAEMKAEFSRVAAASVPATISSKSL
ncbi:MAG TPA: hypothetical protein VK470_16130, partial [Bacteroidota bacterium]|nr:hypothetical protein [Bacteroidota bacterium]